MRPSLCAGWVLVLCPQFGETVLPAEAAQQPGSPFGGSAIARFVAPRLPLPLGGANAGVLMPG